jgi:hypothetical protein
VGHDAVVEEARDRRDPVALEREDDEPVCVRHRRLRVLVIAPERRLAVRPRRHEPHPAIAAPAEAVLQEGREGRSPLVLRRLGRHRAEGVVGQQRDDATHVAGLEGRGEARHELALGGRARQRRVLAPTRGQALVDRAAGPLERRLHRGLGGVEHVGDLGRTKAEHVAQHEHRALKRRQAL